MKTKVLVPVDVKDRLPEKENSYLTKFSNNYKGMSFWNGTRFETMGNNYFITHWYEEKEVYILEEIPTVDEAFKKGFLEGYDEGFKDATEK